jgi:hypothetical protein
VYGKGLLPSSVAVDFDCVAAKNRLKAVRPAIDFFESSVPCHLPPDYLAIDPP